MIITAIDDVPALQLSALRTQLQGRKPGSPVHLTVRDGKKTLELHTTLTSDPQDQTRAIVGVLGVHDAPPKADLPVRVTITPRGLGRGPSAGLAFTLEVYDALSGHRLANGRKIAVTGTIDLAGNVGPIGGVRQKVLGAVRRHADVVLVPDANAADARAAAHGRVKVIAVTSFRRGAEGARREPRRRPRKPRKSSHASRSLRGFLSRSGGTEATVRLGSPGLTKRRNITCDDCYFRRELLCALQLDEPCPTFRPASLDGLVPPPQAPLVPLGYALEDSEGAVAGVY